MESMTNENQDLFDRILDRDFEDLTVEEQAEFLQHYDLEDYQYIQQALGESASFFEREFEELQVHPAVYDDLKDRVNPKPELSFRSLISKSLSYRVPVYQVCAFLFIIAAGFWFMNPQTDLATPGANSNAYMADSTYKAVNAMAHQDSNSTDSAIDKSNIIRTNHEEPNDNQVADTAHYTPGVSPETSQSIEADSSNAPYDPEKHAYYPARQDRIHFVQLDAGNENGTVREQFATAIS